MKLLYKDDLFYLDCPISDNDLARRAGFAWDRNKRTWFSPFSLVANKVARYAGPEAVEAIKFHRVVELKNELASRAGESNLIVPAPAGLTYLPYQIGGIEGMYYRNNILLADQMGLGKTIQVIGLCNLLPHMRRILIGCPATLKINWVKEWWKWSTLDLSIGYAYSNVFPNRDVVVINYDILARHHAALHSIKWDMVIWDEGHYLKNTTAQRTREVIGYRRKPAISAERKIVLTGTPIVNRPIELFNVLKYLCPYGWFDKMKYARRHCNAHMGPFGWDMKGSSNLAELQNKLRSTVMIRRLKSEVLKDLPPKVKQVIEIDPNLKIKKLLCREQAIFGLNDKDHRKEMLEWSWKNKAKIDFGETSTIRKEVAIAKTPYVIKHLADAIASSGKVVCFCHHKEVAAQIVAAFKDEAVVITGATSMIQRDKAVDSFQNREGVKLFVGNIQAAGIGITLTAASHVVFAEISWVPGEMEQCEDRCHRIGTVNSVLIQYMVMSMSIDAAIAGTYVTKQNVINQAIDQKEEDDKILARLLK